MPRPRKKLSEQKGNLTVEQQERKKLEEDIARTGKSRLARAPIWLNSKIAKEEWEYIVKNLKENELIGDLEYGHLGTYCNAFADYVEATVHCLEEPKVIERPTANGYVLSVNPWVDLQAKYAEQMRKAASKCGLDINSRLKAATLKVEEMEEEIGNEFGDI